jgi:Ca-activated chloride channel family protein
VKGTRIGIVAFAGFAQLVMPPTTDTDKLTEVIDNLTTSRGTVIGAATLKAIDAIAAVNPDVAPIGADVNPSSTQTPPADATPSSGGDYVPDIIVLLTDGANTRGIDPVDAAQQAAARRVRVYTIGFGTTNPTELVCTREQLGAGAFDEGGFGGGFTGGGPRTSQFLLIDEPTLRAVAETTGGTFYRAEDADQLRGVFANLPNQVELQKEQREISVVFAIVGGLLAAAAIGLSLLWNRYP